MVTYRLWENVACCVYSSDAGVRFTSAAGAGDKEFLGNSISGRDVDEELIVSLTVFFLDRQ